MEVFPCCLTYGGSLVHHSSPHMIALPVKQALKAMRGVLKRTAISCSWLSDEVRETHPYYSLKVKILRARNIHGLDLLSKADCYVALKLPTASPLVKRTEVIYNSSNPEWNETFEYRVHSAVKNILELTFYNRDLVLSSLSNHATSIAFDTGNIAPGEVLKHTFVLNSQVRPCF
nr:PREDICTED: cytosolic phospholipase A2 zeta [Anolis carolinensis]|eukprot:XP_016847651.1 PREDICTED: cytosolic phospholipase A2 zeta [Anolis carolinensis]